MSAGYGWDSVVRAEIEKCQARRERVLAHPDLAVRLTKPPINFKHPEQWNGYIASAKIERQGRLVDNPSIVRKALIDLCNAVLAAERKRAADPDEDRPTWVCGECKLRVAREEVFDMRDGEAVLCNRCAEPESHHEVRTPASPGTITPPQLTRLHIMLGEIGVIDRDSKLDFCSQTVGRLLETTKNLSRNEASQVIEAIHRISHPEES